jgi:hypothetical protein
VNWEDSPTDDELADVRHAPAEQLAPYLEHAGDINPEGHFEAMLEDGIEATDEDPLVLYVSDEWGELRASVWDGNHRLLVTLERNPKAAVPYVISRSVDSSHPGFPYDGALG